MDDDALTRRGVAMAAVAAASLAGITTLARLTYDAGSNPATLVLLRVILGIVLMPLLLRLLRRSMKVPAEARLPLAACGVGLAMISYGYMASVAYIPVGLAALVLYTFPLIVLGVECVLLRQMPGPRRIGVFVAAFAGIAMALGPSFEALDWRGIALALTAGVGTVIMVFAGRAASRHMDGMATTAYANIFLLPIAVLGTFAIGAFAPPATTLGWAALLGAGAAYLFGVSLQFAALKLIPASLAALCFNVEPVISIAVAWIVLGETMTATQLAGTAITIVAISAGTRLRRT